MNKIESDHFVAIFFYSNWIDLSQYFNAGDLCTLTSCRLGMITIKNTGPPLGGIEKFVTEFKFLSTAT